VPDHLIDAGYGARYTPAPDCERLRKSDCGTHCFLAAHDHLKDMTTANSSGTFFKSVTREPSRAERIARGLTPRSWSPARKFDLASMH
jgi:hypothetical protein